MYVCVCVCVCVRTCVRVCVCVCVCVCVTCRQAVRSPPGHGGHTVLLYGESVQEACHLKVGETATLSFLQLYFLPPPLFSFSLFLSPSLLPCLFISALISSLPSFLYQTQSLVNKSHDSHVTHTAVMWQATL